MYKYILISLFLILPSKALALVDPISFGAGLGYIVLGHSGLAGVYAYFTKPTGATTINTTTGQVVTPGAVVWVDLVNGVPTGMSKDVSIKTSYSDFQALTSAPGVDQAVTNAFLNTVAAASYGQNGDYSGAWPEPSILGKTLLYGSQGIAVGGVQGYVNGSPNTPGYCSSSGLFPNGSAPYYILIKANGCCSTCTRDYILFYGNLTSAANVTPAVPAGTAPKTVTQAASEWGTSNAVKEMFSRNVAQNASVPHDIIDPATGTVNVIPTSALSPYEQTVVTTSNTSTGTIATLTTTVSNLTTTYNNAVAGLAAVPPTATQSQVDAALLALNNAKASLASAQALANTANAAAAAAATAFASNPANIAATGVYTAAQAAYDAAFIAWTNNANTTNTSALAAARTALNNALAALAAVQASIVNPVTSTTLPGTAQTGLTGTTAGTAYAPAAGSPDSQFGNRFDTFVTAMKASPLFSLPSTLLGSVPAGGSSVFNLDFGRFGTTTFDLANFQSSIDVIRVLVLMIFGVAGFRIVALKGGGG